MEGVCIKKNLKITLILINFQTLQVYKQFAYDFELIYHLNIISNKSSETAKSHSLHSFIKQRTFLHCCLLTSCADVQLSRTNWQDIGGSAIFIFYTTPMGVTGYLCFFLKYVVNRVMARD